MLSSENKDFIIIIADVICQNDIDVCQSIKKKKASFNNDSSVIMIIPRVL